MQIVGLVTEYNPFHNGHKYHIGKALEITGADAAIVIMSGDFVQRGAPSIMPKHLRTEVALQNGAALVLELPCCYATGSAEFFAKGAIEIFHKLGCVDSICFGSECGDIEVLAKIAHILANEPNEFKFILQEYLKHGVAFPLARQHALIQYTNNPELSAILSKPNNTLALEYLKALIRLKSPIKPYTIQRMESDYHEKTLRENYSSASAIRELLSDFSFTFDSLKSQIPASALYILEKNYLKRHPIHVDDLSLLLKYKLLTETKETLLNYADMNEDLANRIINKRNQFTTWSDFCNLLKTKEITYSRISRVLTHILLNIHKHEQNSVYYARLLGFQKEKREILHEIKIHSEIPLITKLGNISELSEQGKQMLDNDIFASDLYESVISNKYQRPFINEYQKQIVII